MRNTVLAVAVSSLLVGSMAVADESDKPLISRIDGQYYFISNQCVSPRLDSELTECRRAIVQAKESIPIQPVVISAIAGGLFGLLIGIVLSR